MLDLTIGFKLATAYCFIFFFEEMKRKIDFLLHFCNYHMTTKWNSKWYDAQ